MSHTLLLADDSVTTHRVLELTFAGQDIRVLSVADGEQAIERMRTMRPDILFAEVALPRVDGYRLADHVRSTPALAGVPVVLLMGAFDVVDEPRVRASGAADIVVKPFEREFVIKLVKDLLGISSKEAPALAGRLITPAEPPPPHTAAGPRVPEAATPPGKTSPATVVPPSIGQPSGATPWHELRERTGLAPDTAHVESPAGRADNSLDQLHDAFASLDRQLSGSSTQHSPAPPQASSPATPAQVAPAPSQQPVFELDRDWFADSVLSQELTSSTPRSEPASLLPEVPASHGTTPPETPRSPSSAHHVADSFHALLAAEQGAVPQPAAPERGGLSDDVIDRIARRVAERLSDGVLMETVTRVVTPVAERLVREEIARIRAKAEAQKK